METIEQQSPAGAAGSPDDLPRDPTRAADIQPTVARNGNVVAVMPPSAIYLRPALAALSHRAEGKGLQVIVLASEPMMNSVEQVLTEAWPATSGTVLAARAADRAADLLRQERVTALITSSDTALALLARSSLPLESAPTVLMAWPETWDDDATILGLMQDLPAEAQRILYTAEPARAERWGERYLRKAMVLGVPPHRASPPVVQQSITVASVTGIDSGTAVRQVLDIVESISATVWTATAETESTVTAALKKTPRNVRVTRGSVTPAELIVAADLPVPEDLSRLAAAAKRLVVLTPPWGIPYLVRQASALAPLQLPGAADQVDRTLAKQRSRVAEVLEAGGGDLDRAINALAPIFQHHDPTRVAAALYRLWTTETLEPQPTPGGEAPTQPPARQGRTAGQGHSTKVFVTAGTKDGATAADFVAMLTRDLKVPPKHIGKIELRETFSLIELPTGEAQAVAEALTGRTIRRRKIIARLERQR